MKRLVILVAALLVAAPAHAQLGGLMKKVEKAQDAKKKLDAFIVTDKEERQIGEQISTRLRERFGVYQDAAVTKYVSLVGTVLAQASDRKGLDWQFIVLDTEGVNAFAAPGGLIHITKGLLGLIKTESQLAGVLGHEITHVTGKHTVHAIQQTSVVTEGKKSAGTAGGGWTSEMIGKAANQVYEKLYMNDWSRDQEQDADEGGIRLANKVGYAPTGLADALKLIADRNKGNEERNGLFASHPAMQERIAKIQKQSASEKLTSKAVQQPRYAKHITFDAKPLTEIAVNDAGAAGLAGSSSKAADKDKKDTTDADKKNDEGKKKGGLLSGFSTSSSSQKQSSQTIASAGARGLGTDRDAKGGTNKSVVNVKVTPAEIEAFKKGIVA